MQLMMDKIGAHGLGGNFHAVQGEIRGPNDSLIIFRGMQAYNAESIKSLEGYDGAWVEEAQTLSQRSMDLLRPTIRKEGSELWFSWNPESEFDPVDTFLRGPNPPHDAIIRQVNYTDNPWFPDVLRAEMELDRRTDAAKAAHVWDGDYQQAPKGAYYADLLAAALHEERIGHVPAAPVPVDVSFDLGVGRTQALWFSQRVGKEMRLIDYMEGDEEAAGEGYSWYARKMREKKYTYGTVIFPHDGRVREATGKSRAETMEGFGFAVRVLDIAPVQDGIDAVQRLLPICWIDAAKCATGLTALKNYRDNWDDKLRRSNGPLKDWTNHASDSLRYTAMAYEEPPTRQKTASNEPRSWMS